MEEVSENRSSENSSDALNKGVWKKITQQHQKVLPQRETQSIRSKSALVIIPTTVPFLETKIAE